MKWFLLVCLVAGGAAVAASSCGPERAFCPSTHDMSCFFEDGGPPGGSGGQDQGPCDGASYVICPNGGAKKCSFAECP